MSYNYISADALCTKCGAASYFPEIQFKYGLCRDIKYLLGSKIESAKPDWKTRNDSVRPAGVRFVIDGIGRCPKCQTSVDFQIGILDDVIMDVNAINCG